MSEHSASSSYTNDSSSTVPMDFVDSDNFPGVDDGPPGLIDTAEFVDCPELLETSTERVEIPERVAEEYSPAPLDYPSRDMDSVPGWQAFLMAEVRRQREFLGSLPWTVNSADTPRSSRTSAEYATTVQVGGSLPAFAGPNWVYTGPQVPGTSARRSPAAVYPRDLLGPIRRSVRVEVEVDELTGALELEVNGVVLVIERVQGDPRNAEPAQGSVLLPGGQARVSWFAENTGV
ncbi:hypothetical protein EDC01DRAFT_791110 [Geopyxis carbonaria]|nr:hypothetical protein EDC01DRAFT_791110 [Geopyxis carbonaria]